MRVSIIIVVKLSCAAHVRHWHCVAALQRLASHVRSSCPHIVVTPLQPQELVDSPPPDLDAASRADLSHLPTFTIDDASTTEVDDGLSIEQLPDGTVRCWIHVADPTRWLEAGSGLEREARRRQRTLYFPWGLLPMFPRVLAEGPFRWGGAYSISVWDAVLQFHDLCAKASAAIACHCCVLQQVYCAGNIRLLTGVYHHRLPQCVKVVQLAVHCVVSLFCSLLRPSA